MKICSSAGGSGVIPTCIPCDSIKRAFSATGLKGAMYASGSAVHEIDILCVAISEAVSADT